MTFPSPNQKQRLDLIKFVIIITKLGAKVEVKMMMKKLCSTTFSSYLTRDDLTGCSSVIISLKAALFKGADQNIGMWPPKLRWCNC